MGTPMSFLRCTAGQRTVASQKVNAPARTHIVAAGAFDGVAYAKQNAPVAFLRSPRRTAPASSRRSGSTGGAAGP